MEKQLIGKSKMESSRIVLGCMRLADKTIEEAKLILLTSLYSGINTFDHADIYGGNGKSEEVFGKAFKEMNIDRSTVILQSKVSIRPDEGTYDLSYDHIINSVDGILNRLQTSYLDILLLHRPDALMDPKEVARAFDTLHKSGKVKHFGVSNFNPHQIDMLQHFTKHPIITNQVQFSLAHSLIIDEGINVNLDQKDAVVRASGILEHAVINNITLQAWSPFQHGFIEGPFIDNPEFEELNAMLDTIAEKYDTTKTAVATAWILTHPAEIQVTAGSMNPSRIKEIALGTDIKLSRKDWYDLYKASGKRLP